MCIKSVVSFPEFNIQDALQNVKSKKGRRKIKENALGKVRASLVSGENIGHPAFWLNIPLPDAHTTHELAPLFLHQRKQRTSGGQQQGVCISNTTDGEEFAVASVGEGGEGCVDIGQEDNDGDGLDAITHIINVAAQYGGKVQILQKSNGGLIQFQLDDDSNAENTTEKSRTLSSKTTDVKVTTDENISELRNESSAIIDSVESEKDLSFSESPS